MLRQDLQVQVEAALTRLEHLPHCRGGRWSLHDGPQDGTANVSWQLVPPGHGWIAVCDVVPGVLPPRWDLEHDVPHDSWHCTCQACGVAFPLDKALGPDLSAAVRQSLSIQ